MTDIAKEYGAALFMLAKEEGKADAFAQSLERIGTALSEQPDYTVLLSLPNIAKEERVALIETAFASAVEETVLSFCKLLCEEGYMHAFFEAKAEFDALYDDDKHISHATVTSAVPLTDDEKHKLILKLQALSGHTVEAHYLLDTSLLGGVIVDMDGTVYDGSVKRQMHRIKEVIEA